MKNKIQKLEIKNIPWIKRNETIFIKKQMKNLTFVIVILEKNKPKYLICDNNRNVYCTNEESADNLIQKHTV